MIPEFNDETGTLPLGRYRATVPEIEDRFVTDEAWDDSSTRQEVFDHWLKAKGMLDDLDARLVECAWLAGSFVSSKMDPDDMDCLFILSADVFDGLPSNSARRRVLEFNKKDRIRDKTGLRVEPFVMVRRVHPNPWAREGGTVNEGAAKDLGIRGAWDDWWQRMRQTQDKDAAPTLEDASLVRGYLEVHWQ